MALITLSDIQKTYGANLVLENVSFQVEEKDRIGLIGANGTGKTTLLRILAGLDEPDHQDNVFAHRQAGMAGIKACRLCRPMRKNTG